MFSRVEVESLVVSRGEGRGSEAGEVKILLVTSAWHMKRAKMLFDRAGLRAL